MSCSSISVMFKSPRLVLHSYQSPMKSQFVWSEGALHFVAFRLPCIAQKQST